MLGFNKYIAESLGYVHIKLKSFEAKSIYFNEREATLYKGI